MANNKKSFFNEIGFKPTIDKLVDLTPKLYLEDFDKLVNPVNGGQIITLVSLRESKSLIIFSMKVFPSFGVLFIFQLPATIELIIIFISPVY